MHIPWERNGSFSKEILWNSSKLKFVYNSIIGTVIFKKNHVYVVLSEAQAYQSGSYYDYFD